MTLKQYLQNIETFVVNHPEALDYEVVSAADSEGNSFELVAYTPSIGQFDKGRHNHGEWTAEDNFEEGNEANAVCIN